MNKTDIQRYVLYGALALLSFMLLVEWQQFRTANQPPAQTSSVPSLSGADELPPASMPAPVSADTGIPDAGDPALELQEDQPVPATMPVPTHTPGQFITVETDTMRLRIDLEGGDIIDLALLNHFTELDRPDLPFVLLEKNPQRTYVAQSGLIGPDGIDTQTGRARYTASAGSFFLREGDDELLVELRHQGDTDAQVTKRYRFSRNSHLIGVEYGIDNRSTEAWRAGLFAQIRRDDTPAPGASDSMFAVKPFLGFATRTVDEPYRKFTFDDISDDKWTERVDGGWIAMVQHYFISAWIPDPQQQHSFSLFQTQSGLFIGRFTSPAVDVPAGASTTIKAGFYAGPKDQYLLQKIASGLDLTVDYGWLWWIAQPLFALLYFFATGELHIFGWSAQFGNGTGNWGWSIVLLTILIKALFFHLSATSYRSMANMRKLQPKMLELRERYADDRQKMSQATMELYRKEKVNPLGGCLPILIQMPVFIALYWTLLESVELRHAPFILWIRDMSVMDPFFVLPLLMGASMFFQQRLNPPPPDPMQAKIFQIMPIMFTFFFLWFPAGLVLYWLVNNLLSITQQWVITRRIERAG